MNITENIVSTAKGDVKTFTITNSSGASVCLSAIGAGITAIIQKWLNCDCKESPETIARILVDEYQKKNTYRTQKTS